MLTYQMRFLNEDAAPDNSNSNWCHVLTGLVCEALFISRSRSIDRCETLEKQDVHINSVESPSSLIASEFPLMTLGEPTLIISAS